MITRYLPYKLGSWLYDALYVHKKAKDDVYNWRLNEQNKIRISHLQDRIKALESVVAKMNGAKDSMTVTLTNDG